MPVITQVQAVAQNTQHLPLHHAGAQRRGGGGQGEVWKSVEEWGGGGRSCKNREGAGEGTSPYLCKPFVAVDCKTRQDSLE